MALDTFDNLKLEIIAWSHRNDLDLFIDSFIELAEKDMRANVIEPLKLRPQETMLTFSTNTADRFVALPADYQSMRKIRLQIANGQSIELYPRIPDQLNILDHAGLPRFFTITNQVEFDRVSDIVYSGEFQYFADFVPLETTNQTNNILTDHPKIYLYGALSFLFQHAVDEQLQALYYNQFIAAIQGANNADKLGRYGPAPVMTMSGSTP